MSSAHDPRTAHLALPPTVRAVVEAAVARYEAFQAPIGQPITWVAGISRASDALHAAVAEYLKERA